jgi:proteic killer suppression protein
MILWIDAAASAVGNDRVNDSTSPSGIRVSQEEPPLPTHRGRPNCILYQIIVDLATPVTQVTGERIVFIEKVTERFAHGALGQELRLQFHGFRFECLPDCWRFIQHDDASGLPAAAVEKVRNILTFLQGMEGIKELYAVPGWRAHQLSGDRAGTWSLTVTRNWRITFKIKQIEGEVIGLNFEDYH